MARVGDCSSFSVGMSAGAMDKAGKIEIEMEACDAGTVSW